MILSNAVGNILYMSTRAKPKPRQVEGDHHRLTALWDRHKERTGMTQAQAGKEMGIKQTLVSHYLSGRKPLGTDALLRWARLLGVSPLDIQPEFEYRDMIPGKLSPVQIEVATLWPHLPTEVATSMREQIKSIVRITRPRS